jgi:hypothetical protein
MLRPSPPRHRKKDSTTKYTKGARKSETFFVWFVLFVVKKTFSQK